jgi:glycosyltransferase involved in cell wall biosynthesis
VSDAPPSLSVLMPAFNEEATIVEAIERVLAAEFQVADYELLVVENGSQDRTRELLRAREWPSEVRVIELERNIGKGGAVRAALEQATGSHTAILDADLEYDAAEIPKLLAPLLSGEAEAVIGTRTFRSHSSYGFWYVIGGRAMSVIANALYNAWISDVLSCMKVAPTATLRSLGLREGGFAIDAEIPARLLRAGKRIYEVPIAYRARSRREGKKLTARDGILILITLIRSRFDRWSPSP